MSMITKEDFEYKIQSDDTLYYVSINNTSNLESDILTRWIKKNVKWYYTTNNIIYYFIDKQDCLNFEIVFETLRSSGSV